MRSPNDLWEAIGDVGDEDFQHVLTNIFIIYEQRLERKKRDKEALDFFKNLDLALRQTEECNLNRR